MAQHYKTTLVLAFLGALLGSLLPGGFGYAVPEDNVSGFAWSDTIGWVSFNSTGLIIKVADGSTNLGGASRIYSLLRASNGDIFAGTGKNGDIWKSEDNGATWTEAADGVADLGGATRIYSLLQASNGYIFAGTAFSGDIYRSTDNGATWEEVADGFTNFGATRIWALLQASNGYIFAGLGESSSGDIWKSEDNGDTWAKVADGVADLGGATEVYALLQASNGYIFTGTGNGANGDIWKSEDNGATWTEAADSVADLGGTTLVSSLLQASNGDIFAGLGRDSSSSKGEIYRSEDNGATWTEVADQNNDLGGAVVVYSLLQASNGDIFASTGRNGDIYKSADNGATWIEIADGSTNLGGATRVSSLLQASNGDMLAGIEDGGDIYKFSAAAYGLDVDGRTGVFFGYAWAETIGWIKFNPTTIPPGESDPAPATIDTTIGGTVCGGAPYDVCGWARACAAVADKTTCEGAADPGAGGWDGWVKLRDSSWSPGVRWDNTTEEFHGWAWGGGTVLGWLSFNCENDHDEIAPGVQTCIDMGGSDYFVFGDIPLPPIVSGLGEIYGDYCTAPDNVVPAIFQWTFYDGNGGDVQDGFQVAIKKDCAGCADPDPATAISNLLTSSYYHSCRGNGGDDPQEYTCDWPASSFIPHQHPQKPFELEYRATEPSGPGAKYYWSVRVKDSSPDALWSEWGPIQELITIRHQYPDVDFTISPAEPSVGEVVTFLDSSACYWSNDPGGSVNVRYDCFEEYPGGGPALYNRYEWDFEGNGVWCDSNPSGDGTIENADCFPDPDPVEYVYNQIMIDVPARLRITDAYLRDNEPAAKLNPSPPACTFTTLDPFDVFPRTIQWREISPF